MSDSYAPRDTPTTSATTTECVSLNSPAVSAVGIFSGAHDFSPLTGWCFECGIVHRDHPASECSPSTDDASYA